MANVLGVDKKFIENPLESALDNLSKPDESKGIKGQVLLEGLGPRYLDCHGDGPLPVDGDLLPGIILGYEPPFRVLPYGVRSKLGNTEATALRRLARTLPPHFAIEWRFERRASHDDWQSFTTTKVLEESILESREKSEGRRHYYGQR
ncbi:hypothetical protein DM860_017458 [Cuscuta australis]|uniref:Uncharacterized protein n=1 Tax=Cuscuta australis TaxID=267555 RepID=A0A328DEM4_9ASTE|nr:hypothetical protein DM860_017458 [Cuscuta australis]